MMINNINTNNNKNKNINNNHNQKNNIKPLNKNDTTYYSSNQRTIIIHKHMVILITNIKHKDSNTRKC